MASTAAPVAREFSRRTFLFCSAVSAFTGVLYWRYNVAIRARLYESELRVRSITSEGFKDCQKMLKDVTLAWEADVKERSDQLRALQLQNVEQTRSVARLEGALKTSISS